MEPDDRLVKKKEPDRLEEKMEPDRPEENKEPDIRPGQYRRKRIFSPRGSSRLPLDQDKKMEGKIMNV